MKKRLKKKIEKKQNNIKKAMHFCKNCWKNAKHQYFDLYDKPDYFCGLSCLSKFNCKEYIPF